MLSKVKLVNFLSHELTEFDFSSHGLISISGENGSGKSAVFEAVRFALYGDGRASLKHLVRNGSEFGMVVELVYTGDTEIRIERGVTAKGTGKCKVYSDGELVVEGGADPKSKVQPVINRLLGMELEEFAVTSFFGLQQNDYILSMSSSDKLDFLQRIAHIDECAAIKKLVDRKINQVSDEIKSLNSAMAAVQDLIDKIPEDITDKLSRCEALIPETEKELSEASDALQKKKIEIDTIADTVAIVDAKKLELVDIKSKEDALTEKWKRCSNSRDALMSEVKVLEEDMLVAVERVNSFDVEAAERDYERAVALKASFESEIDIKEKALQYGGETQCPLCESEIDASVMLKWEGDVEKLRGEVATIDLVAMKSVIESINSAKHDIVVKKSLVAEKTSMIAVHGAENEAFASQVSALFDERTRVRSEIAEYESIIDSYDALKNEYVKFSAEVSDCAKRKDALIAEKSQLDTQMAQRSELEESVADKAAAVETLNKQIANMALVSKGFSRTEIPLVALKSLRMKLEAYATEIIRYFIGADIKIVDIEGGRPGIEFVLVDGAGERPYSVLSKGESAMCFLAVRVAMSRIISQGKSGVDFIVLDEILDGLDVDKIESVMGIISVILRKFYKQIFVVSHIQIPDIFDAHYTIYKNSNLVSAVGE